MTFNQSTVREKRRVHKSILLQNPQIEPYLKISLFLAEELEEQYVPINGDSESEIITSSKAPLRQTWHTLNERGL